MSVERNHEYVGLSCYECPEATEEFKSFDTMIASAKSLGWKIYQEGGEWCHKCPACAEGRKGNETDLQRARRLLGNPRGK